MPEAKKARAVGFNHIALEVGDIDEVLAFYGRLFEFTLRGRSDTAALHRPGRPVPGACRRGARKRRTMAGISGSSSTTRKPFARRWRPRASTALPGPFLDFRDPWGNRVEIVGYDNIQFTKAPHVLRGMGLAHLSKNDQAVRELTEKGMAPA